MVWLYNLLSARWFQAVGVTTRKGCKSCLWKVKETYGQKKKEQRLAPTFVNLKSNTMKNTVQRYGFFGYLQIFWVKICVI